MELSRAFGEYRPWSGAESTYNRICDEGMLNDLERLMDDLYPDGMSETQLNDILWFEEEWVFEQLGIKDEEDEEEE